MSGELKLARLRKLQCGETSLGKHSLSSTIVWVEPDAEDPQIGYKARTQKSWYMMRPCMYTQDELTQTQASEAPGWGILATNGFCCNHGMCGTPDVDAGRGVWCMTVHQLLRPEVVLLVEEVPSRLNNFMRCLIRGLCLIETRSWIVYGDCRYDATADCISTAAGSPWTQLIYAGKHLIRQ